jgi:hypothetical protein
MNVLLGLLNSTGLTTTMLTMIINAAVGAIYPRLIDLVKAGGTQLASLEADSPLVAEALDIVKMFIPSIGGLSAPDQASLTTALTALVQGAVGSLSASDPSVTGTTTTLPQTTAPATPSAAAQPAAPEPDPAPEHQTEG